MPVRTEERLGSIVFVINVIWKWWRKTSTTQVALKKTFPKRIFFGQWQWFFFFFVNLRGNCFWFVIVCSLSRAFHSRRPSFYPQCLTFVYLFISFSLSHISRAPYNNCITSRSLFSPPPFRRLNNMYRVPPLPSSFLWTTTTTSLILMMMTGGQRSPVHYIPPTSLSNCINIRERAYIRLIPFFFLFFFYSPLTEKKKKLLAVLARNIIMIRVAYNSSSCSPYPTTEQRSSSCSPWNEFFFFFFFLFCVWGEGNFLSRGS